MEIAQGFMIRVDNKFRRQQVLCGVFLPSIIQFFTKISNWVALMTKYSTYAKTWGITFYFKRLGKSGRHMTGASVIFCFTPSKALVATFIQLNSLYFMQLAMGDIMVLYQPTIKGCEPMKALNVMDIFGLRPIHNCLNLLGVSKNSLWGYDET